MSVNVPRPGATPARIKCRMCQGDRPTDGKVCLGCGTPVANAIDRSKVRKEPPRPPCPMCQCSVSYEIEPGRFSCRDCMAVFERPDTGYLDDRPEQNATKRERQRAFNRSERC